MKLPEPDTHCFDEDTQTDVWSYSKELMIRMYQQGLLDGAEKCDANAIKYVDYSCAASLEECAEELRVMAKEIDND